MTDMTDPRVAEFRSALAGINAGLSGPTDAHERYRNALGPYVTAIAEMTPADHKWARKTMMAALYEGGLPLGVIAIGFKATNQELSYVSDYPPVKPEVVDEQERLAAMPYGMYLRTAHWRSVRKAALKRSGGECAICRRSGTLEVHHRTYERKGAERPADVIVLCASCHGRHHGKLRAA